jgi:hypothetical protein
MKKRLITSLMVAGLSMGVAAGALAAENCANAQQDIEFLKHEKKSTGERMVKGVTSITPVGFLVHTVKGTEQKDLNVAIGTYNDRIDAHIAAIKRYCNVQ